MTSTAPSVIVRTADTHEDWNRAFSSWVSGKAANTARAYNTAWNQLFTFSGKTPWEINRSDVTSWVEAMNTRGLAAATIAQRLAAVSSFFTFLGEAGGIVADNPAGAKSLRPKVQLYSGARFLSPDDAKAILGAIKKHTDQGSRDYALFLTYLFTGRRNSEVRTLKWGDIELEGFRIFYRWSGKGKARRDELPRPCFEAIEHHLRTSGRLANIKPDEFIFQASNNNSARLPHPRTLAQQPCSSASEHSPLSMHQVEDLLKTYTKRAGITSGIRVHDLRHTAAMLRRAAGDDVLQISDFLGHSNLSVTQVYLHQVEGRQDTSWQTVGALLGLGESHISKVAQKHGR